MEMDLCWITAAGADPLKYFVRYPGRFPLVHVKDLKTLPKITAGGAQNYGDTVDLTEVGSGIIDWKKIFAQSQTGRDQALHRRARSSKAAVGEHHEELRVSEHAALVELDSDSFNGRGFNGDGC